MDWGEALPAMLKPALIVGPFLGALGGFILVVLAMFGSGGAGAAGVAMLALIAGLILGLVIATPLALVAGTIMLHVGAADPRWLLRRAWAIAGLGVGGVAGALIGGFGGDAESLLVTAGLLAFLGLVGALLCRRMLNGRVAALDEVDVDVFS